MKGPAHWFVVILTVLALVGIFADGGFDRLSPGALMFTMLLPLLYFLPSMWAETVDHRQKRAIFLLNLLLGWTLLGWIGSLIWTATKAKET